MNAGTNIIDATAPRRDEVLAFIIAQIARYGIAPTFDEIGHHIGTSKSRARQLVGQLVDRGVIEHTPGTQRSFRVVDVAASRDMLRLTLQRLGWIQAAPLGALVADPIHAPIPRLPALEYLPDPA